MIDLYGYKFERRNNIQKFRYQLDTISHLKTAICEATLNRKVNKFVLLMNVDCRAAFIIETI